MRKRGEIEREICLVSEEVRDASLFNQMLMIEILLDIREKLEENSPILNIEHMTEIFRESKKKD